MSSNFSPRIRHQRQAINLNSPDTSDTSARINRQTWGSRYRAILSASGYNTGRRIIKALPITQWLEQTEPATWFIDADYFYYSLLDNKFYVDFTKFRDHKHIQPPINYFSGYLANNEKIFRLFGLLQQEKFHLVTKQRGLRVDPRGTEGLSLDQLLRQAENRMAQNSLAPEIIVRMMELAWNADLPEMNHALIFSQDVQILPAVQHLASLDIATTIAIAPNRNMSNYFLSQFAHVIDMFELLDYCGAIQQRYSPRRSEEMDVEEEFASEQ